MDRQAEEIRDQIQRIAGPYGPQVLSGKVKKVDAATNEIEVVLTGDDDAVEVLNNVSTSNLKGVYMLPVEGADCEVAELDGPGKWTMIRASEYDKVYVKAGTLVQFNDGALGGLVKVEALTSKLNALENKLNALITKYDAHTHLLTIVGTTGTAATTVTTVGSGVSTTNRADIENTKIKQG